MAVESSYYKNCTSCGRNLADFNVDLQDYEILLGYIERPLKKGDQRLDDAPIPELRSVRAWTEICHWCENSRICSEFFRGAINPLLRTLTRCLSEDAAFNLQELRKGLQSIGETPHVNMRNEDGRLCELVYKVASERADDMARIALNHFGHSSLATPKALDIDPGGKSGQSKVAHGTRVLANIFWDIHDPVDKAESENGDELNLNTMVFPASVTLELTDRYGHESWKIRAMDTSVRGILQIIHDFYAKYEADHEDEYPMGDYVLFHGMAYEEADELWTVDFESF